MGYSFWEARQYTLRRVILPIPDLARSTGQTTPLTILHLSDLHLAPRDTDRMSWVTDLGRLRPDLTVVTGDFCGHVQGPTLALQALAPLLSGPGLFVRGSNDYFAPTRANPASYLRGPSRIDDKRKEIPVEKLSSGLQAAGWIDLDNSATTFELSGWRISARGVDDPHIGRDDYRAVSGPYPKEVDLRLAVTHAPYRRVLDPMARDQADLILAGHTHGGQMRLPGFGAIVTNCDLPRKQARGLSRWGESALHVSGGLGTNPFTPIRMACRPEATLLTLQ